VRQAARITPIDRLLVETVRRLAEVRGCTPAEIAAPTIAKFDRLWRPVAEGYFKALVTISGRWYFARSFDAGSKSAAWSAPRFVWNPNNSSPPGLAS
jgi:hypothetical protein